ncbi:MAG: NAD-dependent epimerase/dehydratase family protein [Candidatus Dormibacterales bacterium]
MLAIGGTGFIGVAACRELMRRGHETVAASRSPHPYGTFTSHQVFDRTDESQLQEVLERVRPEVVVDLACYGPAEVEAVVRRFRGDRYVFVSTVVYPDLHGRLAREQDFVPPEGPIPRGTLSYLEGKRWCETVLARSPGFPWVTVRPPAVLGAQDPTLRIAAYFQRVEDGGPVLVPAETFERGLALAWAKDVGYALALAADPARGPAGTAYNVAFEGVTLERLISGVARLLGRQVVAAPVPFARLPRGASPYGPDPARHAGLAVDHARAELGFSPSTLEEALAETAAWYRVARPGHPGYAGRAAELSLARSLA